MDLLRRRLLRRFSESSRLQIAVQNAFLVCVLNGATDLHKQFQSPRYAQATPVAELGDRQSIHPLHDKKRASAFCCVPVQHLRDMRMVHHGERLPFYIKARQDSPRVHPRLD